MLKTRDILADFFREKKSKVCRKNLKVLFEQADDFLSKHDLFFETLKNIASINGPNSKNLNEATEFRLQGNDHFKKSHFFEALNSYTNALKSCPLQSDEDFNEAAKIYTNRATCFQNLNKLEESLRDSVRAIKLKPNHSKAWFRLGKVLAARENRAAAKKSLLKALDLERQLGGQAGVSQVQAELTKLEDFGQEKSTGSTSSQFNSSPPNLKGISPKLEVFSPQGKGLGLRVKNRAFPGEVLLEEGPYATVLLKTQRKSRCHYCFTPVDLKDSVPCTGCLSPLYCGEICRYNALGNFPEASQLTKSFPSQLGEILGPLTRGSGPLAEGLRALMGEFEGKLGDTQGEHFHECGGASWPAVLPERAILAVRLLYRYGPSCLLSQEKCQVEPSDWPSLTDQEKLSLLWDHLDQWEGPILEEIFTLSISTAFCLFSISGDSRFRETIKIGEKQWKRPPVARAIFRGLLLVHINAITVRESPHFPPSGEVEIHSANESLPPVTDFSETPLALAVFPCVSLLNHSCQPRAFPLFRGRNVFLRAAREIPPLAEVEISYGPQVGFQPTSERKSILTAGWHFECNCTGCTFPDKDSESTMDGYNCPTAGCDGALNLAGKFPAKSEGNIFSCSKCGNKVDCKAAISLASEKLSQLLRESRLSEALVLVEDLELTFHKFNLKLGQAYDHMAKLQASEGQWGASASWLKKSLEILSKHHARDSLTLVLENLKFLNIVETAGVKDLVDIGRKKGLKEKIKVYYYGEDAFTYPMLS